MVMVERRNFYRLLHIQPDASFAVIQESYRVLTQSQRNYSDISVRNWNTDLFEAAFQTLQDQNLRAIYNRELLKRYPIRALSQGAFGIDAGYFCYERVGSRNRRNYYRVLQVQPDAPDAAITASYRILKKDQRQDGLLLDEAYRVLSSPAKRKSYDVLFACAATRVTQKKQQSATDCTDVAISTQRAVTTRAVDKYQVIHLKYCLFCNTSYVPKTGLYQHETCLECASPLHEIAHENFDSSRRMLKRIPINSGFMFYLFWPDKPYQGVIQDISPVGIRFAFADTMLTAKDIIKIDASNFQAVAEITYTHYGESGVSAGTRFITVKFNQQRGNFISAHA
ncbi:MAG: J domain-containing protein [Nitrosomonas sp.]|nr:MAG: J domain-containing protein [Nitrosomonas sp.]